MNSPFDPGKAYALSIGIGNREVDSPAMATSANDARRIGKELVGRAKFMPEKVQTLINADASVSNVLKELDKIADITESAPADMVIIYFSGHGCVKNDIYYIVCRDTVNSDVEHTAIKGSVFVEKLKAIRTDKMLIFLDCCHSGGMYDPIDIPFDEADVLKMKNRVIISASKPDKVSYLSKPLSIFTYALVEGLAGKFFSGNDTDVTLFDLAMYLRERVVPLSENKQQPQLNILRDSFTSDFVIARYPNGQPRPAAFDEDFSLLTNEGKDINTNIETVKDEEFRKEFSWMVNVSGNNNTVVGVNNGTITTENTVQNAEKIVNMGDVSGSTFNF